MDYPFEELKQRYLSLPDDLQEAISSVPIAERLQEIAESEGLRVDEIGEVADETAAVLLGITRPDNYTQNLSRRIHTTDKVINKIADDVNEEIFRPVRKSLMQLHEKPIVEKSTATSPEKSTKHPGFAPLPKITSTTTGIERTMPRDILQAKLKGPIHTTTEKHNTVEQTTPTTQDPYREPIE